jgi:hypothetical protein
MERAWSFHGWYFARREELLGPVTAGELRWLLACGSLAPTDLVWGCWTRGPDSLLLPCRVREAAVERRGPGPSRLARDG